MLMTILEYGAIGLGIWTAAAVATAFGIAYLIAKAERDIERAELEY
jgi:hypothetical protein